MFVASRAPIRCHGNGAAPGRRGTRIGAVTLSRHPLVVFSFGGFMDETLQTLNSGYAVPSVEQRNRVLRNTYWLLALSMVPTVLGAWVGVASGLMTAMGVGMSLVVFMVGAFGFIYAIEKTKNSAAGVPVLLGFTFFMGLMLSRLIGHVLGYANGTALIMVAFAGTGVTFLGMATLSSLIKRDLSTMGKFLYVGAIMLLVGIVANLFVQSSALFVTIAVLMVGIFSAFIVYDLKQVRDGQETNYISATLKIYLDLYNIFQALLSILGFAGGSRD
jgi:modulator of FtsH protease